MSFRPYPEYKDSGVEWLGKVPAHWRVKRLKYGFRLVTERAETKDNPIALENIESWSARYLPTDADFSGEGTSFGAGDVLFGKLRPYLAKAYLANSRGEAIGDFHVLRPSGDVEPSYGIYYIVNEPFISAISGSTYGAKMPRIGWDVMGSIPLLQPPRREQRKICSFLDHEIARTDALIEEQQRLIELLKEKRQAVISHAVTKGLDPDVPMKDSGVEWLGKVPAHWEIMSLKWRASSRSGDGIEAKEVESVKTSERGIPVIGGNGINGYTKKSNINPPALILGRVGALCGNVHLADCPAWVTDNALIIEFDSDAFDIHYLGYLLEARDLNDIADKTAQPLITGSKVRSQAVPVPPEDEQKKIVSRLHEVLFEIDAMRGQVRKLVGLLKERRSALISAAVTGKIDVRSWEGPEGGMDEMTVKSGADAG
ncbi:MAG: restriction endonuclease subunit S [Spiribacter salinus]|uniref:Restriction endonuclease subunit S n=1 Tax=Spiribacter salinus TaxID=1335746 RepID=A0A540VMU9_9GAMM|nr:MAG: restriction endonuclease subunit S [Spiribacter salinus]